MLHAVSTSYRLRSSLALFVFTLSLIWAAGFALLPLTNPDTFFHLRFGHEFLSGWAPWDPPALGALASGDWIPTQWAPQVLMGFVEEKFGLAGVTSLYAAVLASLVTSLYWGLRSLVEPLMASLGTALCLAGVSLWLTARPVLASFILMGLLLWLVIRAYERDRAPWLALPLIYAWVLTHGSWLVGLGLIVGVVIARVLQRKSAVKAYLKFGLAACATPFLTILGPGTLASVLSLNHRGERYTEWGPLDVTSLAGGAYLVSLLALIAVLAYRPRQVDWLAMGFLSYASLLGLVHGRAAALGTIILVFALARQVGRVRSSASSESNRPSGPEVFLGVSIPILVTLAVAVASPTVPTYQPFSTVVSTALSGLPQDTLVYSHDYYGSIMLYTHPNLDPYPHGQVDVYSDEEWEEFGVLPSRSPGWLELLDRKGIQYAVFPLDEEHYGALELAGWRPVVEDSGWGVLAAPASPQSKP